MTDREMLIFIKKQLERMHSLFDTLDKEYSLTVYSHEANELFEGFVFLEEDIQTQLNKQEEKTNEKEKTGKFEKDLTEFGNRVDKVNAMLYEELLIDTYKKIIGIGKILFKKIGKTYKVSYEFLDNNIYEEKQYVYITAIDKADAVAELHDFYKQQDDIIEIISVEEMTFREGE
jgi:hypothetical protein